jgi:hypothetical protein
VVRDNSEAGLDLWFTNTYLDGGLIESNQRGIALQGGQLTSNHGTVRGNRQYGISAGRESYLSLNFTTVSGNQGNGINLGDIAYLESGPGNQVVSNAGWGLNCEGPPALAFYRPWGEVQYVGNGAGDINCAATN